MVKRLESEFLRSVPELPDLHGLLSQALEKRGQQFELRWQSPESTQTQFTVDVMCSTKGSDPQWKLHKEVNKKREFLFQYPSCDVLLIYNLIYSACGEPTKYQTQENLENLEQVKESGKSVAPSFMKSMEKRNEEPSRPLPEGSHPRNLTPLPSDEEVPESGNLTEHPVPKLLQSIVFSRMTGMLEIRSNNITAIVYFKDGFPIDATAADAVGDDAIIELLTWNHGQFSFEPRIYRNRNTVHQSVNSLLEQSKQLAECIGRLQSAGLEPGSVLTGKYKNRSQNDFMHQQVHYGPPLEAATMSRFYQSLTGLQTVDEMMRTSQIPRIHLIYMIHNLVVNDLVTISSRNAPQKNLTVAPRKIDPQAIQGVMMSLRRADSGMFIYPAFLYFLEQEYFRCYRSKSPLSVIVFQLKLIGASGGVMVELPLPSAALLDAVLRISALKRHVDLLAHYDSDDYALVLPNTKAGGAEIFANRIVKSLLTSPLAGNLDASSLSLAFGSASVPEDFVDLSSLLGAADLAMQQSRLTKRSVVMYRDLKEAVVGQFPQFV